MEQNQFGDNIEELPVDHSTPPYHDAHLLITLFDPKEALIDVSDNIKVLAIAGVLFLGMNMFLRKRIQAYTKNEWMTTGAIITVILAISYIMKNFVFTS